MLPIPRKLKALTPYPLVTPAIPSNDELAEGVQLLMLLGGIHPLIIGCLEKEHQNRKFP